MTVMKKEGVGEPWSPLLWLLGVSHSGAGYRMSSLPVDSGRWMMDGNLGSRLCVSSSKPLMASKRPLRREESAAGQVDLIADIDTCPTGL